jgi:signal transduction histidine kinase
MRGKFLGTVSIFRDITHQVEVDRLKSDFVATVSHELRTPMTSIRGYVDILLMGAAGSLNEQQAQFLGVVKRNTKQLSILVNDLLDVSRIESGKVNLNLQELDVVEIINEAINALIRLSKDEDKKMLVEFEPDQVTPPPSVIETVSVKF